MSDCACDPQLFEIKQGARFPILEIDLVDCKGEPLDLTPYTVAGAGMFVVVASCIGGRRIVDMGLLFPKAGVPLTAGTVVHPWLQGETDKPGVYMIEVYLNPDVNAPPATEAHMILPGSGYGKLVIYPHL